jgi:hypothetical protein
VAREVGAGQAGHTWEGLECSQRSSGMLPAQAQIFAASLTEHKAQLLALHDMAVPTPNKGGRYHFSLNSHLVQSNASFIFLSRKCNRGFGKRGGLIR